MRIIFTACFLLCVFIQSNAQQYWQDVSMANAKSVDGITYTDDRTLSLDWQSIKVALEEAKLEFSIAPKNSATIVTLPFPDGRDISFKVIESPVMMPKISARYPNIKSYKAYAMDNEAIIARFDISPNVFHASISSPEGRIYIEPIYKDKNYYRSFYAKNTVLEESLASSLTCGVDEQEMIDFDEQRKTTPSSNYSKSGAAALDLRTYRLAISCTGEYGASKGGTIEQVLATFVTATNRINEIYENEAAIRFLLINETDSLIFLDGDSDPFLNPRMASMILGENSGVLNARIGFDSYDIGHNFTLDCDDSGGVAIIASVCNFAKGNATSCHSSPNVSFIAARTFAHEVGHQFSATHTLNNCPVGIGVGARGGSTAYEPGSGSTIMSYAGGCGEENVANNSDDYFHVASLEQIINYSRTDDGNDCAAVVAVGNEIPTISMADRNNLMIPISTPFELTAIGSDADDDNLTYCWEQYNLELLISTITEPRGNAPTFRSLPATSSPTRTFPKISTIANNRSDATEVLPTYTRDFKFRCTVRDNHPAAGGVAWEEISFKSDESAGPFLVTQPNASGLVWEAGSYQEIIWDVANTDNSRVNCQRVNIKLSLNAGATYPITLSENTPNDGSAFVTMPLDINSNNVRIKVEAADNIFFDISNRNFAIRPPAESTFAAEVSPAYQEICLPSTATFLINTAAFGGFDAPIKLSLQNVPDGTNPTFSDTLIAVGENATLTLDLGQLEMSTSLKMDLVLIAEGIDTIIRPLELDLVSNDFSALTLVEPSNNTTGIVGVSDFVWTALPNANSYDFELATSPTFGATTLVAETGIRGTSFRPDIFLEDNTLYYWRIRPINQCGAADYSVPNIFQTINVQCSPFEQTIPITIPGNGTPTVESIITIETEGTITDLNIPNVIGRYQPVRFIEMSLISPAGTQVILFDNICGSTTDFNLGFDDEAPDELSCPPTAGTPQQPIGNLSDFDGESIKGDWTLRFRVRQAGFGGGGRISSWSLESCGDIAVSAPFLLTNEVFELPPASRSQIWTETLEADDEDNSTTEISFQLVSVPKNGTLYRNETALAVGDRFTQEDINGFLISYEHDGSDTQTDAFYFVLLDTDGGWFGTNAFNINISSDATVDTEETIEIEQIKVYPNPANSVLNVEWTTDSKTSFQLNLYNINGQLIKSVETLSNSNMLDINDLTDGIYFLSVQSEKGRILRKIVVQR